MNEEPSANVAEQVSTIKILFGEIPKVLTDVQQTATDLYQRGFNVFPLPTAREWRLRPDEDGKIKKAPYTGLKLGKVYTSRLNFDLSFVMLFERANIGVVCGRTSGNLVAIDCDSDEAYKYMGKELAKRGIGFWATKSNRGGHYLMRIQEGEAANISKGNLKGLPKRISKDVEVLGHRHYIVLPPSIHPLSGAAYHWEGPEYPYLPPKEDIPVVSIQQLKWLGLRLVPQRKQEERPEGMGNISNKNYRFWQKGAVKGERNKKLTALLYDLAGNGVDSERAFEIALIAANRCSPPYSKSHLRQMVESAYGNPRTPARSYRGDDLNPQSYPTEDSTQKKGWELAWEFAQSFDWRSQQWTYTWQCKTGLCRGLYQIGTLRADKVKQVFLALVKRSKMEGRTVFRATEREVSRIASVGEKTARYAIQALLVHGLLQSKGRTKEDARLISFGDISKRTALNTTLSSSAVILEVSNALPKTNAQKDVFGSSSAYLIWQHLLKSPEKNANQTAKKMNIPASTVYKAFERLEILGLISHNKEERKYVGLPMTDAGLKELSVELGTQGKAQRKFERHQEERQKYLNGHFKRIKAKYQAETVQLMAAQESSITTGLSVVTDLSGSSETVSERVEQTPVIDFVPDTFTVIYSEANISVRPPQANAKAQLPLNKQRKKELVNLEKQATYAAIRELSDKQWEKRRELWQPIQALYERMRNTGYSIDQNFPPTYDQFRHLQTHEDRRAALQQADREWYVAHPERYPTDLGVSALAYGD